MRHTPALYQALLYAVTLGLKESTLVYPQSTPAQPIKVSGSDIRIVGIDLSLDPNSILHSVKQLVLAQRT